MKKIDLSKIKKAIFKILTYKFAKYILFLLLMGSPAISAIVNKAPTYILMIIILVSLVAAIFILQKLYFFLNKTKEPANLLLEIHGDVLHPKVIKSENIFKWNYLINPPTDKSATLFISFKTEVPITTLEISSPDIELPKYEVKEYNQKYAIICFSEALPTGTLEIKVGH